MDLPHSDLSPPRDDDVPRSPEMQSARAEAVRSVFGDTADIVHMFREPELHGLTPTPRRTEKEGEQETEQGEKGEQAEHAGAADLKLEAEEEEQEEQEEQEWEQEQEWERGQEQEREQVEEVADEDDADEEEQDEDDQSQHQRQQQLSPPRQQQKPPRQRRVQQSPEVYSVVGDSSPEVYSPRPHRPRLAPEGGSAEVEQQQVAVPPAADRRRLVAMLTAVAASLVGIVIAAAGMQGPTGVEVLLVSASGLSSEFDTAALEWQLGAANLHDVAADNLKQVVTSVHSLQPTAADAWRLLTDAHVINFRSLEEVCPPDSFTWDPTS